MVADFGTAASKESEIHLGSLARGGDLPGWNAVFTQFGGAISVL